MGFGPTAFVAPYGRFTHAPLGRGKLLTRENALFLALHGAISLQIPPSREILITDTLRMS